jgi:glycogen(starch) synthase
MINPAPILPARVLMSADPIGGVWTYALELIRALGNFEVEVVLATMGASLTAPQRAEAASLANLTLQESAFLLEWMDDPWPDVAKAGDWLLELADQFSPDIVHLNGYAHAALEWKQPVVLVAHSCVLSWWRAVKRHDAPDSYDRYRKKAAAGLRKADFVVAPSEAFLAELENLYGPFANGQVIYNGRRAFDGDESGSLAGLAKEPFILSGGRLWDEAKNISTLAGVAPQLRWPVYVAGDSRNPSGHVEAFSHLRSLGKLSADVFMEWMRRAAIFCLPARYEPFGLSALEAAQQGCALVLGDIPSQRELWGDSAVFVHPNDAQGLADALNQLSCDEQARLVRAAKAMRIARQFTPELMAGRYLELYARALATRNREEVVVCAS